MSDIINQTPSDKALERMSLRELCAVQNSWLKEKEKVLAEMKICEDVLIKVHMELTKKGQFTDEHAAILKRVQGDSNG